MTTQELTVLVDGLRRDRRRHPYAGRREYSQAARELAGACGQLLTAGQAAVVVPVLRKAVDRMTTALMYMDDSSGIVGNDLGELMTLYARACAAAPPKPKALAGWLVTVACDGPGWPAIRLGEFVPGLGETGLTELARLVDERAATVDPESWTGLFAVRDLREQLAEVSGDTDRHVAVLAEGLTNAVQYGRIVAVLRAAGRTGEAIDWARRCLAGDHARHQGEPVRDALVEMLLETDQPDAAVAERRTDFTRHPVLATYRALLRTAEHAGVVSRDAEPADSDLGEWALAVLRERFAAQPVYLGELIEVLVAEDQPDQAWRVGVDHRDRLSPTQLLRLLELRRITHPAEVIDPYQQRIEEQILDSQDKYRYRRAVTLLRSLRDVFVATGNRAGFDAYLYDLRVRHKRRPTFLATLDKAQL